MCNGKGAPGNKTRSSGNSGRRLTQKLQCFPASAGRIPRLYAPLVGVAELAGAAEWCKLENPQRIVIPKRGTIADRAGFGMTRVKLFFRKLPVLRSFDAG